MPLERVAVIGGGWAGIAAAVELAGHPFHLSLFEAGRDLGGRARSIDLAGRRLDNGQHILLGAYRASLALMRRVGADPAALLERRPLRILDNTGFRLACPRLPAPLNLAWGLLTARGLDLGEKIAAARWIQRLKAEGFRPSEALDVAAWLETAGQSGKLARHLWEPLCLAALSTPIPQASARVFAAVLRDSLGSPCREATDLLIPRAPLGALLPEPAAAWLSRAGCAIHLRRRVRSLEPDADGVRIDGETFDAVILATAPRALGKLLPSHSAPDDDEPIATAYLQYSPAMALPFPLFGLRGGCGQWVIDRGGGLLAAVMSGHGEWETKSNAELAQTLGRELGFTHPPRWYAVTRERRAAFSCRPGAPRPAQETASPRLFLAGDHVQGDYPATLEGAVRSGIAAAQTLLARLSP